MYIIFINDKPFVITTGDIQHADYAACERVNYLPEKMLDYIKKCETLSAKGMVLITEDTEMAFKDFYTHFVPVEAAGGIVYNKYGEVLLIKRMGKWDLPKGKIDPGETRKEAAKREVEEECGIKGLKVLDELPTTYHTYKMHNYRFLKITYWYSMITDFAGKLVPQTEEQITDVKWVSKEEAISPQLDTYLSIHTLLKATVNS